MRTAALCLALVLIPTCQAQAGWQYTQWGMSMEEVLSASKGAAHPTAKPATYPNDSLKHLLDGTYESGDFTFNVQYIFRQRKLEVVILALTNPSDCALLRLELANTYGKPQSTGDAVSQLDKWWDETTGNVVAVLDISPLSCSVRYSPYHKPGEKGSL